MKKLILTKRKYTMLDYFRIPFQIAPFSLLGILCTAILLSLVPTFTALTTASFVDAVTAVFQGSRPYQAVFIPIILVTAVVAFDWVQRRITHFLWVRLRLRMTRQYMTAILEKKARLHYSHIENAETWDLIKRVCGGELADGNKEYQAVEEIINGWEAIQNLLMTITQLAGLLAVYTSYAWWSGLVVLILSVPMLRVSLRNGKRNYGAQKQVQTDTRRVEYLGDVLRSREYAEERSLFDYSDRVGGMFQSHLNITVHAKTKAEKKGILHFSFATLGTAAIWFTLVVSLLPATGSGAITLGAYIALIGSADNIVHCIANRLAYNVQNLSQKQEYIRDLDAFVNLSETEDATTVPAVESLNVEKIRFENVRFAYPGTEKYILNGVNLEIRDGVKYAFVGANGAGKTTMIKLLTGLYTNYEGSITVNGRELRELSAAEQKALFAVVHQDFARYSVSIRDNIALGNVNAMESGAVNARVDAAVQAVELTNEIRSLPRGLDTELGRLHKDSYDFSGGQWQRIAVARATVSDAPVVILDEPTAALDPIAESNLYHEFGQISRNKTSIFISHRLGSTKLADVIYVFSDGKVTESGTHAQLMAQGGLYAGMYDSQKEWYV